MQARTSKNLMLRIFAILLCCTMLVGVLAGCNNEKPEPTPQGPGLLEGSTPGNGEESQTPTPLPEPLNPGKLYSASASVETDGEGKVTTAIRVGNDGDKSGATIPAGVLLEQGTKELTLDLSVVSDYEADISAKGGDVIYPLDIHVAGVSKDNTVPVLVKLNKIFPKNYARYNISLFHVEGEETKAMTAVDSPDELDSHNEFYYDPATGNVTVAMASFSEVTAVVANDNPWNGEEVFYDWYTDSTKRDEEGAYVISNAAEFAGFAQIVGGMAAGIERDSFEGKTVKLAADVNMGSTTGTEETPVIFTPVGYYFTNDNDKDGTPDEDKADIYSDVFAFSGTFDGQGHTISNIYQSTWSIKGDDRYYDLPTEQYYNDGMGIFGWVNGGTVKNLAVINFQSDGEYCTTGVVAAYSSGNSTFENIRITNCNPRAYNVPNGGVVGYAYDETDTTLAPNGNSITFKDITVDPTSKISALWGSWDVGCGGILGRLGDTAKLTMTDCSVGAIIDVYNDVCANYQYYQYRYCGMLIGTLGSDGDTSDQAKNCTFDNVQVYYGDWSQNYHYYCELVENTIAAYTHDYQFSRLTKINTVGQIKDLNGNWNQTGNFVVIDDDGTATCYHIRKDADGKFYQHNHNDYNNDGTDDYEDVDVDNDGKTENVLVENNQCVHIPFKQFYAGYGWGADHSNDITTVAEAKYTITFMNADGSKVLDVQYITDEVAVSVDAVDDIALNFLDDSYTDDFGGWITAGAIKTTDIAAGNTANYVLYPTYQTQYTARWLDENGNVIHTQTISDPDANTTWEEVTGPESSAGATLTFKYWEIRNADKTTIALDDCMPKDFTSDVTFYPFYELSNTAGEGSIALNGIDTDGDGVVDEYSVEAASGLVGEVVIPGNINGIPVKVVTDISSDVVNGLFGDGISSIELKDGVETIEAEAFAMTNGLKEVTIPASVTSVGANAFASNLGALTAKKVTINYAGTWEMWQAACNTEESTDTNWDSGLGNGSKVVCTDGTYVLSCSWGEEDHTWSDWTKQ